MKVKELIAALNEIVDKDLPVVYDDYENGEFEVESVVIITKSQNQFRDRDCVIIS